MDIKPDHDGQRLDRVLHNRRYNEASPQFAERIIAAALRLPQQQPVTLGALLARICAEFMLPKPAYALSVMLLFGVVLGVMAPISNITDSDSQDTTYVQQFLYEDEGVL
jgi:hypothetical protein